LAPDSLANPLNLNVVNKVLTLVRGRGSDPASYERTSTVVWAVYEIITNLNFVFSAGGSAGFPPLKTRLWAGRD
jgi:hypothetical protein